MPKPELILATLTDGAAALFVNSDAILTTGASAKERDPEIVAPYLARALGVDLFSVHQPPPDDPAWSWNDVYAAITPKAAASTPRQADAICARLLDSEEHAVEAAIPPVAEEAVEVIHALQAAEQSARRGLEAGRSIIDDLLEYAVRFAEVNDEPATSACWPVIEAARGYLRDLSILGARDEPKTASASPGHRTHALAALRANGLTIGECIEALAVPDDDPYVAAARAKILGDDKVEIDDRTTTSVGDQGAWVLAWLWVSDEWAGFPTGDEQLEPTTGGADANLHPYRVMLHEEPGDKFQLTFECMAEDADHAAEQTRDAYLGCDVVSTARLDVELLSEDELAAFMRRRLENGELAAEDIPLRLARYGLMQPQTFVEEMRERMESEGGN
jgi:hypothetical protein